MFYVYVGTDFYTETTDFEAACDIVTNFCGEVIDAYTGEILFIYKE